MCMNRLGQKGRPGDASGAWLCPRPGARGQSRLTAEVMTSWHCRQPRKCWASYLPHCRIHSCARGHGDRERELRSKIDLLVTGARTVAGLAIVVRCRPWLVLSVFASRRQMVWRAAGGASARYRSAQTFRCGGAALPSLARDIWQQLKTDGQAVEAPAGISLCHEASVSVV
jgi:hypothetical protein